MNDELELYDTTIFNKTLEALDTGKLVYLNYESADGYVIITSFGLIIEDNIHKIFLDGLNLAVRIILYPSEGYNVSDLYTPTNITFSEVVPSVV